MPGFLHEVVEKHAMKAPDHVAYRFLNQQITYKEFNENVNRICNSLLDIGMRKGDRLSVILPQSPAFAYLFVAASNLGLVIVPLDPRLSVNEMAVLCERTTPKVLVTLASMKEVVDKSLSLMGTYKFQNVFSYLGGLDQPGEKMFESLLENSLKPIPPEFQPGMDDPLIVIFTSGTTGRPKGAMITHRNTAAMAEATIEQWRCDSNDVVLCNLPTSHVGGTHDQLAVQLYSGAAGILVPKFNPPELLDAISREKITFFGAVPSMHRLIFQTCDLTPYDLSSVRLIVLGGEPTSAELIQRISGAYPNAAIAVSWGMSETAGFFTFSGLEDHIEVVEKTEGKPAPGFDMKVIAHSGESARSGETGELLVKGPSVIDGYLDKEDNRGTFADGWLKTGDLGFLDENGYLHFVGRTKEMYISGGYNVYPLEIETVLNTHKGINAAAVVEVPDETWGEVGYAFVIPEEGVELDADEVITFCRTNLADYKRPKKVFITNDIPRSAIGKIMKKDLRENIDDYIK